MAFDALGRLHVSSRFDGTVYRVGADGALEVVASELGVACGIAFDKEGALFVGDRSGSILRVVDGRATTFATIPSSVAAFHLAYGPDGSLFVTAPTLATRDAVYRVAPDGTLDPYCEGFGRPQGIAFDEDGRLYVVDALAGGGGLYRVEPDTRAMQPLVIAGGLVGVAFGPDGSLALANAETVYRLDAGVRGLLPFSRS